MSHLSTDGEAAGSDPEADPVGVSELDLGDEVNFKELVNFVGKARPGGDATVKEILRKLMAYGRFRKFTKSQYMQALQMCLEGEYYNELLRMQEAGDGDLDAQVIVNEFAKKYIEDDIRQTLIEIETFRRYRNENIRRTMDRLDTLIDETSVLFEAKEREPRRLYLLKNSLLFLISPKANTTLNRLIAKINECGVQISYETLLKEAAEVELMENDLPEDDSRMLRECPGLLDLHRSFLARHETRPSTSSSQD